MNRYAYCQFCDDIRHEINGKYSLIGLYGGEMTIDAIQAVLPKLCILAFFEFDVEYPPKTLVMNVMTGDAILNESVIPTGVITQVSQDVAARATPDDPITKVTFGVTAILSPLAIESETALKVVFIADGAEFMAGKLRIKSSLHHIPG